MLKYQTEIKIWYINLGQNNTCLRNNCIHKTQTVALLGKEI